MVIFGAFRGYKIALAAVAAWFIFSVLATFNDFFAIEALRNVLTPEDTIAMKITDLFTLAILVAAFAVYFRGTESKMA